MTALIKPLNKRLAISLVIAVSIIIYLVSMMNGFVLDDIDQVLKNPWITDTKYIPQILTSNVWAFNKNFSAGNYYRPMLHLAYMAIYHVFGLAPWAFHLVNVILHSLNALMVFVVADKLMRSSVTSTGGSYAGRLEETGINPLIFPLGSALLFALHPVNTEVVNWVASITELIYTLFFILSFYLFIMLREGATGKSVYILSLLSFCIASLSKEVAILLPFFIIWYDLTRPAGAEGRFKLKLYLPYFVIALIYMVMRSYAVGRGAVKTLYTSDITVLIANIFQILLEYLKLLLFPVNLTHYHYYVPAEDIGAPKVIFSFIVILLIAVLALRLWRRIAFAPSLMALIFAPLLPTFYLLLFHDRNNPFAFYSERYLYLPSIGFVILISFILMELTLSTALKRHLKALFVLFILLLALSAGLSFKRSLEWKDDLTLWTKTIERSPDNYHAYYQIADLYAKDGDKARAIKYLERSIELEPDFTGSHNRLGLLYASINKADKALFEFREALRIDPAGSSAHHSIGILYMDRAMWKEATAELKLALKYAPVVSRKVSIKNALAVTYERRGLRRSAIKELKEASSLAPNNEETKANMRALGLLQKKAH